MNHFVVAETRFESRDSACRVRGTMESSMHEGEMLGIILARRAGWFLTYGVRRSAYSRMPFVRWPEVETIVNGFELTGCRLLSRDRGFFRRPGYWVAVLDI